VCEQRALVGVCSSIFTCPFKTSGSHHIHFNPDFSYSFDVYSARLSKSKSESESESGSESGSEYDRDSGSGYLIPVLSDVYRLASAYSCTHTLTHARENRTYMYKHSHCHRKNVHHVSNKHFPWISMYV
jgi:hypothetical protein